MKKCKIKLKLKKKNQYSLVADETLNNDANSKSNGKPVTKQLGILKILKIR